MLGLIPLAISVAPEIARWLFGPDAATTTAAVAQAVQTVTGADTSTDAGIAAAAVALEGRPELASQLQVEIAKIAAASEVAQRQADGAALAAQLADVANARAQTVALATGHSALQWAPAIISAVVLVTFGLVMALALVRPIPAGSEAIINVMLGILGTMATAVVSYWVGSSSGSAVKTDMLYRSKPADGG